MNPTPRFQGLTGKLALQLLTILKDSGCTAEEAADALSRVTQHYLEKARHQLT